MYFENVSVVDPDRSGLLNILNRALLHKCVFKDQQKRISIDYIQILSFSRYCTRSCLTMMAGVGVAHKLLKK